MKKQHDFRTDWEKTKKQLLKFSKEAAEVAKKGEVELIRISRKGKLHVDSTTHHLKIEKLYYMIGKEFVKIKEPTTTNPKIKKLMAEYNRSVAEEKKLKIKIKMTK